MCIRDSHVGYGRTYRTKRPTKIALVPAGLADGLTAENARTLLTGRGFFSALRAAIRRVSRQKDVYKRQAQKL